MLDIVKSEIIQKARDLKNQILDFKTGKTKNLFDCVILQNLERELKNLELSHPEIEKWEWMGWLSKEAYEQECAIIRAIIEREFESKKTYNYILGLKII